MPINSSNAEKGPGGGGRTTFRPPWVKEGPQAIPMPTQPWSKRNSTASAASTSATAETPKENGQPSQKDVKLQSREIKVPVMTTTKKTTAAQPLKPKEKEVKIAVTKEEEVVEEKKPASKTIAIELNKAPKKELEKTQSIQEKPGKFIRPVLKKVAKIDVAPKPQPVVEKKNIKEPIKISPPKTIPAKISPAKIPAPVAAPRISPAKVPVKEDVSDEEEETDSEEESSEEETDSDEESEEEDTVSSTKKGPSPAPSPVPTMAKAPPPPPPPPTAPGPPPPPPPPGLSPPSDFEKKPISEKQKALLEKLKIRPRKRPDWSDMMKEVESGRKLKHVKCNDRSQPILTTKSITNIKGQYIYETEKANVHNALLKQIQFGVRLKPTRTNDRSKPVLAGLRKFRRQMTIEEQIQKSESRAQLNEAPVEESEDEMDDIDKLRDDLQSTKQMLALELRNKEAQERENKRLLAKIQNLEAELRREKSKEPSSTEKPTSNTAAPSNEALVQSLKNEAEEAQKISKLLEKKYEDAAEQLDTVKNEVEEQKRQIANLEKKLAQQGGQSVDGSRRQSEAPAKDSSPEPEIELSESEEDESEEKKAERAQRRLGREVKMLNTKLGRLKDKEKAAKKERENLRDGMKKNQGLLKVEHKKYKQLQREVDKMAAMMKEEEDEDGEDEDSKPPVAEEAEEPAESEEESESEESGDETDSESESEAEDAPYEKKKENYEPRIKRHEGRVAALKKGNYLLQTNVDRLQDEINKMREKSVTLQADLDSVLSELG